MQEKLKIGEILVRTGLIDQGQLEAALGEQTRWGGRVGVTLVKMGLLSEDDLMRALGSHFGLPVVRLEGKKIAAEVISLLPGDFAEKHGCLPLFVHWENGQEVVYLGMEDPGDLAVLDDVSFRTGLRVKPVLVGPIQVRGAIQKFYAAAAPEDWDEDLPQARPGPGQRPLGRAAAAPRPAVPAAPAAPPRVAAAPPAVKPAAPVAPVAAPEPFADVEPELFAVVEPEPDEATQSFDSSPAYDPGYEQTFDPITGTAEPDAPVASSAPVPSIDDPGASLGLAGASPLDPVLDPGASADAVLAAAGSEALAGEIVADTEFDEAVGAEEVSADRMLDSVTGGVALVAEGDETVDPNEDTRSVINADGDSPRQVPTRDILRAVTQLLIESGIFTRDQLVERVRATRSDRRGSD